MAAETMSETWDYHVFLSFRGADTRRGFVDFLYNIMVNAGIRVFRDDDELPIGQRINTILQAIENSKICMPVFSRNFASSAWCLREVERMVKLEKEIVPIFFDVKPDDVKLRTPVYGDDMRTHELEYGKGQVKRWEDALKKIASIKGRELSDKGHYEFITELTQQVLINLKLDKKLVPNHLLGTDDQVELVLKMLDIDSGGVRCVGIHGMGGIGKTTLAKVIFNRLSAAFDGSCFLGDVRESASRNSIEHLQKDLLSKLDPKQENISSNTEPIGVIKRILRRKKVLIVLDDVDKKEQIDSLVGETNGFVPGSRIIVTSRDDRVFLIGGQSFHKIYELTGMADSESLQLFSRHAFRSDFPPPEVRSLSELVVRSCKGLPLALEVLGSFLWRKEKNIWIDTIKRLVDEPDRAVQDNLKISYDALEYKHQQIFLDIACFFINTEKSYAVYMWDACGFRPGIGLDALVSMSLIKIVEDGKLWMHDIIRDLARGIIREEGRLPRRKCSRLWDRTEEVMRILKSKEGKEDIFGLRISRSQPDSIGEVLAGLNNVRFLSLEGEGFSKKFQHRLPELKWLSWRRCPRFDSKHLDIRNLVILELPYSSINEKWKGWKQIQMVHLKVLDLTNCCKMKRSPDFSKMPNLERLILHGCKKLAKLDGSIGRLIHLKVLDLSHCSSLRELPEELGCLKNLEQMSVHGCKKLSLKEIPSSLGNLKSLIELDLSGKQDSLDNFLNLHTLMQSGSASSADVDLSVMPNFFDESIMGQARFAAKLLRDMGIDMWHYISGVELPDIFINLKVLTKLDVSYSSVCLLPDSIGNLGSLRELKAKRTFVVALPKSIGLLKKLEMLDMEGSFLSQIPEEIGGLSSLRTLNLYATSIRQLPTTITELSVLRLLDLAATNLGELVESPEQAEPADDTKDFTALPTSFHDLPHLEILGLTCKYLKRIPMLPSSLRRLALDGFKFAVELPALCNLKSLTYLCINFAKEQFKCENLTCLPESLRELRLIGAAALPDLSSLRNIRKLVVQGGTSLEGIPGLGKLETLEELIITQCESLDSLENLSELRSLKYLCIIDCPKLGNVEGLDNLPLVHKDLHLGDHGCAECQSRKRRRSRIQPLSWVLSPLGVSASEIPVRFQHFLASKISDESHGWQP